MEIVFLFPHRDHDLDYIRHLVVRCLVMQTNRAFMGQLTKRSL